MILPIGVMVAIVVICIVIGAVALYLVSSIVSSKKRKKRAETRGKEPVIEKKVKTKTAKKNLVSRLGVMNIILVVIGLMLFWFTVVMIDLFKDYGMIPDTLVSCVFVALTGECGVMGWIKTNKEKFRDRKWQKEDENASMMAAQMPAIEPDSTKE